MTSKTREQNISLAPGPAGEPPSEPESKRRKRHATVYDAVAGRVSAAGFIPDIPFISSNRDTASSSSAAVSPEAVLFRRKKAPVRYEEFDFYFASDSLPEDALPDSDLVKALHCYASDFYARATADQGAGDWRSLDETALLALGILMEEVCRESLGETGDLAFTEGEDQDLERLSPWRSQTSVEEASAKSGRSRRGKRRRLNLEPSDQLET